MFGILMVFLVDKVMVCLLNGRFCIMWEFVMKVIKWLILFVEIFFLGLGFDFIGVFLLCRK